MKKQTCKFIVIMFACAFQAAFAHAIKITHGPYLQDLRENEVTLVWITDKPSTGWVELAPDDNTHFYATARPRYFDTNIGVKTVGTIHSVKITGLKPGTAYRYQVLSKEVLKRTREIVHYGENVATDVYSKKPLRFVTLDKSKSATSFMVVNDIHDKKARLAKLFDIGEAKDKDMIFFNGDMISNFSSEARLFNGFLDTAIVKCIKEVPMYYVRGNHETRGPWATRFHEYVSPRNPSLYFGFKQGPVYFVCLDTGEDKPDSSIEYYDITDYDNYRTEQVEWLKKVVESDEYRQSKYHVIIGHMPPSFGDEGDWHGGIDLSQKLIPLLNKADVDLMICGHVHANNYYKPGKLNHFPIVTNSDKSCLIATANSQGLKVEIKELDGSVSFSETFGNK